ncbi:MAG: T9SS type A sorting domain-containing protein [Lewinellaceae bacterium]|nr:T9SS type A sorting domain-containing protein [Lewinellaceae bacterium]
MAHFFSSRMWRAAIVFAALLLFAPKIYSQCNPDITPPTAICAPTVFVSLPDNGPAEIDYWVFDAGSFDVCCLGAFELKRVTDGPCDSDADPDNYAATVTFCCADLGTPVVVSMRVNDCAGNFTECQTTVTVEDKIKPTCPGDVTVSCADFDPTLAAYGATDNCCIDAVNNTGINYSLFNNNCKEGVISRSFTVADCYGNTNSCSQLIEVTYEQDYYVKFPDDLILTVETSNGQFGEPVFFGEDCELMGVSYEDEFFINGADNEIRQERTWTIINWCTYNPVLPFIDVPNPNPNALPDHASNLPGPTVSEFGTAPPWAPTIVKINPSDPTATDFSTFWNANANAYRYKQIIRNRFFVGVEGTVFSDTSANCAYEAGESLLEAWTVKATGLVSGEVVEMLTDANGYYFVSLSGVDTAVSITLVASSNFGQNCQTEYIVNTIVAETLTQDVPVYLEDGCALLSVGVATPRLRRCFANRYTVQACNLSSGTVPDAYTEVTLDPLFDFTGSSIPGSLVSGNTYSFQLGDLGPGECESFTIDFLLSCEAEIGATHCLEAHVFPYDDCSEGSNWSGADVEVNATCDGDSVRFVISNVGNGDMTQVLDFVVVEDVVMRSEGTFQLNVGGTLSFSQPANGSTWRLEAQEEPQHPWGGPQAVALEGCGGLNNPGLVNLFPLSDPDPFEALDCLENIGAYDPNDKQGVPEGYGSQHYIKANTDLEYLIRFQNTGTDTAFTVVVLDTLSQQLDAASVRVQVASHPMEFAMLEGGILRFTFNNILLPDSNVNQAGSNGFIKFRIAQKPDLANETLIENSAAIYFDFNDPVITNTTFHTVGEHFVTVSTDDLENTGLLRAYPNPASDAVIFDLKEWANAGRFEIFNSLGQGVSSESFTGKQFRFERKNLPAGIYHFQIISNNTKTASGKIMLK